MVERLLAGLVALPFMMGAAAAPADDARVIFAWKDPAIVESSGLALTGGLVTTVNDSGDTGRIFAVDIKSGSTLSVTTWRTNPIDVEALTRGRGSAVWVGDIGDNREVRTKIQVASVPIGKTSATLTPTVYDLAYPDGAHNAETLMMNPTTGRLYVATKASLGGKLYEAPATLVAGRVNRLRPVADVLGVATDGVFFPDGKHLVIRNYGTATIYAFPSLEPVASFGLPQQPQGEGIAVDSSARLLLSTEGAGTDVLRMTLPADALAQVQGTAAPPSVAPTPSAGASPTVQSTAFTTESRAGSELPETTETQRSSWPWFLGGFVGVALILALTNSLRRPPRRTHSTR